MTCVFSHCGCTLPAGVMATSVEKEALPPDANNYGVTNWTDWTCGVDFPSGRDEAWAWKLDLSQHVGMAKIYWTTYSLKDRLLVWIDNVLYLDSGCVGTSDEEPVAPFKRLNSDAWETELYIPKGVKRMWLAVLPNCEGGSGTAWQIKVDCPDGNKNINDKRILKAYRTFQHNQGNYEHIAREWS